MGLSEGGMDKVIERGLVEEVVHLVANCPHLAMRGVCLYILNMFSHTPQGRTALSSHHWYSHNNCQLGWVVIPHSLSQMFTILNHHSFSPSFWP